MKFWDKVKMKWQAVTTDNGLPVTIQGADAQPGFDHQATLMMSAVTHTSAVCVNGSTTYQATWQQLPEGMTEFMLNFVVDSAVATVYTVIIWSEDGTTQSGKTNPTLPGSSDLQRTSDKWYPVGGPFYKVGVWNGDASPRTCTANIKFRP